MLKLAQRMTDNFCSGVCASSAHEWNKLSGGINIGENVRVKTSQNVAEPGEPPGVVLSAATSVWLPIAPRCLFDFLGSKQLRSIIQDMAHIAKGKEIGNAVSLLRASVSIIYHLTHIYSLFGILSLVGHFMFGKIIESGTGYCSVRLVGPYRWSVPAMHLDMSGGDSTYVAFLPSGFAILPDGCGSAAGVTHKAGGSLLTVGFKILVNNQPTAKLTVESVETVSNLISCTVQKIKAAVHC
ncbi:hypothetical protein BHE74_00054816 [Ensete ventricosum]|nr:hypothetical protein BHE74_00054816 [Ensete ventricosum]